MNNKAVELDPVVHAPIRLGVLSILMVVDEADFTYLKDRTGATEGNLSTHLSRLEEAGLIQITKTFFKKRPRTVCRITPVGEKRFKNYLNRLEEILSPETKQTTGRQD
ncbi:MAG TPA: transcriptional regulator [Candidatus Aminicenantes bacterium]|nr:transcriptional regulator [Candidatus Aminicenantes bacterium]